VPPQTPNHAFHDLPATSFPFTVDMIDKATGDVVWSEVVTGPGALRVPSKHEVNGGRDVAARMTFPDGTVIAESELPWGHEPHRCPDHAAQEHRQRIRRYRPGQSVCRGAGR
jgi:hypothetical protein